MALSPLPLLRLIMDIFDGIISELMSVNSAMGGKKRRMCPEESFKDASGINYIPLDTIRLSLKGFSMDGSDSHSDWGLDRP